MKLVILVGLRECAPAIAVALNEDKPPFEAVLAGELEEGVLESPTMTWMANIPGVYWVR